MKLVFLLANLEGVGGPATFLRLMGYLATRGHQCELAVLRAEGPRVAEIPPAVRLIDLGARLRRPLPSAIAAGPVADYLLHFKGCLGLARVLRQERPDAVVTHPVGCLAIAAMARGLSRVSVPIVARVSNMLKADLRTQRSQIRQRVSYHALRMALKRAQAIICEGQGVRSGLMEALPDLAVTPAVIYPPCDLEQVRSLSSQEPEVPLPDGGRPLVVAAGGLTPQKAFDALIRAIALIQEECRPDCVILGEGPLRDALLALAQRIGVRERVSLPGWVGNPWAVFKKADAFVLSSAWEGFGMVIVEAMACGTPVISTDCDYGPREIITSGVDGLLVPPDDPQALSQGITDLLSSPPMRDRLRTKAYDTAHRFDMPEIFRQWEAVLDGLGSHRKVAA